MGSRVARLLRRVPILAADTTCGAVAEHLNADPDMPAVVIEGGDGALGLVDRISFLPRFLDRFNRDLFHRKPIGLLMDKDPLVVEWDMPIERAGMLAADGTSNDIRSAFIIVRDGKCAGVGLGTDLMRVVAEEALERLVELRQAQDHLVQAQTFASLGRLVAGVAHEINTPIGVSLTASTHLRERVSEVLAAYNEKRLKQSEFVIFAATAEEASSIIVDNIERAAELIRSFKSVAADQTSAVRRVFRLRELINNTLRSLSPALRKAQVETDIDCDPNIEMDSFPGPLTQVLTNLALNSATHAFTDSGGRFAVTVKAARGFIDIACMDNGRGIPPENRARIFEPFFTTNRSLGGSGLGLHIVHNIVTQVLGGTIVCETSKETGTIFHMRLPQMLAAPATAKLESAAFPKESSEAVGTRR